MEKREGREKKGRGLEELWLESGRYIVGDTRAKKGSSEGESLSVPFIKTQRKPVLEEPCGEAIPPEKKKEPEQVWRCEAEEVIDEMISLHSTSSKA